MKLNALVMSRSQGAVNVLMAAFAELEVDYKVFASAHEAMDALAVGYYSALIVDFDLPQAIQVAKMSRTLATKHRPVLFGMVGASTPVRDVFQAGANFVLYKPLDLSQILHSFRAAQVFMRPDRRNSPRQKSETLAYLQMPTGVVPALVLEVTEQGLSLQAAETLTPLRGVPLRFLLPGTTHVVQATGDFIWTDSVGRAGLFFSDLSATCRRDLQAWLKKRGVKKSNAVRSLLEPQRIAKAITAAH